MATADQLVAVALAEAAKDVTAGPGNANPYSAALGRPPEEWCSDFVDWCFTQVGMPPHGAGVANQMLALGVRWDPAPGDLVFYDWSGHQRGADHVGIVTAIEQGGLIIRTVEGNAPDPTEGGRDHEVAVHAIGSGGDRTPNLVSGYGRPHYDSRPPPPPPPPPTTTQTGDAEVASVANLTINTDGAGNGYNDLTGVPFAKVIGLFPNGSDPQGSGRYSPIPRLAALDEGGHCRVVLEGGPPSGAVLVHVAVAS